VNTIVKTTIGGALLSKEKRPRRTIIGSILGVVGGLWALSSFFIAGAFIFAGAVGGGAAWFWLGILSWILPPITTGLSLIASILMVAKRYRAGGIVHIAGSALILTMLALFVIGGALRSGEITRLLPIITFFWTGPFALLLIGGICGLTAVSSSRSVK